jgi:nucleoid-associated protein YgaU
VTSTAEKAPQQNSGIREQDIANLVLPAALPAQPAMKQEDSQQEKSPKEEPYEQRKVQPPVHVSDLSVEQEVDQQRSILVKYGDTLEKLALRYLGSRYALNEIIDDNPQIIDINRIYPGQKIYLSRSGHTSAGRVASHSSTSFADTSHVGDSGVPGSASAVRSDSR